jgi:hypothetical protein
MEQKVLETLSQPKKLGVGAAIISVTVGSINVRITVKAGTRQKARPCLHNNHSKKGWRCGSSGIVNEKL